MYCYKYIYINFADALTDGSGIIQLDGDRRPVLRTTGIASKNTKGKWNVLCGDQTDVFKNADAMAGQICSILGFR